MGRLHGERQKRDEQEEIGSERAAQDREKFVDGAAAPPSPPLGDDDEQTRRVARLFWGFNSLSFSFAIATVMAGAGAVLPVADLFIEDAVARVRDWLAVTAFLLLLSAAFVLGAFGAAGFASMTTVGDLEANMTTTTIVGGATVLHGKR
ncbi:hypothetical protein AXG93_3986s1060 [Marchantia polymorpha subsp. ruderalis]|uniref:PGG domain-containing protein n=1 Tax=Marchantia polymorpha subsp. ruderalis TaxID=1480154 RepID=A0A176VS39_MARPO|nr:hypothetical protein AXG93_3986s1060 [Marchantia polymorpha subsp. ruderalis]